ncbi:uncharacterized protein LOC129948955 [Eupeodes corollae]|uniref:uncharacterized protein LOC129948955 n=1 Tax=Eupeodes corollae TaxID=290404 RepID=UPI00248F7323|nr:uncharacterized protein LOC129948955 [Eupeodes corollae]
MNTLKQARGHFKRAITRAHTFIIEAKVDDIEILKTRLERLEESWKSFCLNQIELFQYCEEEGYVDPEIDFETTENKYLEAKSAFLKAIQNNTPPIPPSVSSSSANNNVDSLVGQNCSFALSAAKICSEIELPKFKIPPFSGDYRQWPEFRDMFLGSIDCKKLTGAQKMRYLKSFLENDAAKLLNGIEISDANYEQAWEKLEHRYDKPLYIVNSYIESFLKISNVAIADSGHLRRLVDKSDEVIRGLKAVKAEGRDPWLIYILLEKLDFDTRKAWSLHTNHSESETIDTFLEFLGKRSDALEACAKPNESKSSGNRQKTRPSNNIKSLAVAKQLCPMCKENHVLSQCSKFIELPISSRRSFARDQKLCYRCLGTNHSASRCRSKNHCPHCSVRHHVLVHMDSSSSVVEPEKLNLNVGKASTSNSVSIASHHSHNEVRPSGILPTVVAQVMNASGKFYKCRMLLDTGSQASFITENLVRKLGLSRRHARLPISGISSIEACVTQGVVSLNLRSCVDLNDVEVDAFILNRITTNTPLKSFRIDQSSLLGDLKLADPGFNKPGPIDILLGSDKAWSILREGRRTDEAGNLVAHNTLFGWVITGCTPNEGFVSLRVGIDEDVDVLLRSFWEVEEIDPKLHSSDSGDFVDTHFVNTFSRAPDNKYIVELPFRQKDIVFSNTLSGALSRLFSMERRFARQPNLRFEYCCFMRAYLQLGHMEKIPEAEIEPSSGKVYYLPHHAVVTNKLRVVFDGSHRDGKGVSLNEVLHVGPPLQRNLINVCLRFRVHKYVFGADIVKMFRQIWIDPNHRDFQRIVWRENSTEPVSHYRLRTVTYGTSPAPFLAMRVLKQLALEYKKQFPIASLSILHDCYVDDIMTGAESVTKILELKNELVNLLACGGLELSKWSSNCWPVLEGTSSEPTISLDRDSSNNWTKVLGLIWNPHRDILSYKISMNDSSSTPTKRKLLSEISKIFDPLGFLAPSTILLKMLFQELWAHSMKIGWDDPLPTEVAEKWILYREELFLFEKIEILRRCTFSAGGLELIGFSDASEKAYSAVVYARSFSEDGQIEVQLISAKTRVAPIKQLSIPRLELCGALLLSRLVQLVRNSLNCKISQTFAFCDSQIVLAWLSAPPRRWNTFVANRTSEILGILPRSNWNFIRSEENPADCASRGVMPSKLLNLEIWWKGPKWLSKNFECWDIAAESEELKEVPESRRQIVVANVSCAHEDFLDRLCKRISSWDCVIRIVAVFVRRAKNGKLPVEERVRGYLRSSELLYAKQKCLKWAQKEFEPDKASLKAEKSVLYSSKLSSLAPFVDHDGLLRVGGRISKAVNATFSMKHPVILPKNHQISKLILTSFHLRFLHAGVSELFSIVRQEFWILGSRNLIRKVVHDCIGCFRQRQATSQQLMGDLPSSRLSPSFAFDQTGCDYAGPITLRLARGRNPKFVKGYFAIFVCMTTKALHLEVVSDLSTDAFLAALRRFIARRGKCSIIYSDNGTNFRGAASNLSDWYNLVRSENHNAQISRTLAADSIRWEFIPPHSPHFAGLWEAGVKSVKTHLRRVIGNNMLTFEEMTTLLSQIEALLNSRPLCSISDSDLNPLTPSHFLIGRPYTAIPEPNYLEVPENRLGRWQLAQNMLQGFWRRWHSEYLTSLQQRPKWHKTKNFEVGDLVVVKEQNLPPSKWALGRIEILHPGDDGLVRVVSLRTKNGIFQRPITKLAILPCS